MPILLVPPIKRRVAAIVLAGVLGLAGALFPTALQAQTPAAPKRDACTLLTPAEVAAVQGAAVEQAKASEQTSEAFQVSQCFYVLSVSAKSVSLSLATSDPRKPSAVGPREFWKRRFHPAAQKQREEKEGELEKPRAIAGLGEEAFWAGNRITGALYVLKKNAFLRISVGGGDPERVRIEKSKALAHKALKRL